MYIQKAKLNSLLLKFKDPVIFGSIIVFAGTMGANFLNYLFQILAGRLLSVHDYGILITLFSLSSILVLPLAVFNTAIVKIVSEIKAQEDFASITALFVFLLKISFLISVICGFFIIVFAKPLLQFFRVDYYNISWFFVVFLGLALILTIPTAFLQGLLRFKGFSFFSFASSINKLLFGVGFTLLVANVAGTFAGLGLGALLTFIVGFLVLKKNLRFDIKIPQNIDKWIARIIAFGAPSSLTVIALAVLLNIDVILVKHYFDPVSAGIYSSLAIIGRILYFAASSIALVLFPLASETHAKGKPTGMILFKGLSLSFIVLLTGMIFFAAFPSFTVKLLFGQKYSVAVPYLWKYSLFMFFYTYVALLSQYLLSINKVKVGLGLLFGCIFSIIFMIFRHGSLNIVLNNLICTTLLLVIYLVVYYICTVRNPRAPV